MSIAAVNASRIPAAHYRPASQPAQPNQQRTRANITDDYERWYTEATPSNRMLLSLRSGIDSEIAWALERLCRLCDNEQFVLKAIPGLTDVLFEWPEWYAREGPSQVSENAALFSPPPEQERKRRHALECLFILRNAALNELNAIELSTHPRTQHLIFQTLLNIKLDSDANTEFILHAIELLQAVAFKIHLPHSAPPSHIQALKNLEEIAGQSSDRSLIIASLTALNLVYSTTPNALHMAAESDGLSAAIRYLPLFADKALVDSCLNYLYTYLSYPPMAKAFLLHSQMPSVLRLLVSLLLSEQVEESVLLDITGPVQTAPAHVETVRNYELTKEEFDSLLPKPEPERCYDWMKIMFVPKADGELTQVDFWNLYKDIFTQHPFPSLGASDVIKSVSMVFPQAQAMVLAGPVQRFVIRGVDRRKDNTSGNPFKCQWNRSQCGLSTLSSPGELYEHLLEHVATHEGEAEEVGGRIPCLWSTCAVPPLPKASLNAHILTHLSSSQPLPKHPTQDDTITLPFGHYPYPQLAPTSRPPPPPRKTTVTFRRPMVDPPSSSLTALLCIRILFRTSFISTDEAPRLDADHFGFPGIVEDSEGMEEDQGRPGENEKEGERRGKKAFMAVLKLMQEVQIKDETLMSWIEEMVDAGITGTID
ncbi:hypothetical protein HWV62_42576 [Athelia sp. TMB]|nr:hypothetical protein HWV62_42576 [Athelia sp. TMB]